jgi:muconolactone delta-isomerase
MGEMKILAVIDVREGTDAEQLEPYRAAEARYAWARYAEGTFREIYHRSDKLGAVVLLEVEDFGAAAALLDELPMLRAGFLEYELIGLAPFTILADLFAAEDE